MIERAFLPMQRLHPQRIVYRDQVLRLVDRLRPLRRTQRAAIEDAAYLYRVDWRTVESWVRRRRMEGA